MENKVLNTNIGIQSFDCKAKQSANQNRRSSYSLKASKDLRKIIGHRSVTNNLHSFVSPENLVNSSGAFSEHKDVEEQLHILEKELGELDTDKEDDTSDNNCDKNYGNKNENKSFHISKIPYVPYQVLDKLSFQRFDSADEFITKQEDRRREGKCDYNDTMVNYSCNEETTKNNLNILFGTVIDNNNSESNQNQNICNLSNKKDDNNRKFESNNLYNSPELQKISANDTASNIKLKKHQSFHQALLAGPPPKLQYFDSADFFTGQNDGSNPFQIKPPDIPPKTHNVFPCCKVTKSNSNCFVHTHSKLSLTTDTDSEFGVDSDLSDSE